MLGNQSPFSNLGLGFGSKLRLLMLKPPLGKYKLLPKKEKGIKAELHFHCVRSV